MAGAAGLAGAGAALAFACLAGAGAGAAAGGFTAGAGAAAGAAARLGAACFGSRFAGCLAAGLALPDSRNAAAHATTQRHAPNHASPDDRGAHSLPSPTATALVRCVPETPTTTATPTPACTRGLANRTARSDMGRN